MPKEEKEKVWFCIILVPKDGAREARNIRVEGDPIKWLTQVNRKRDERRTTEIVAKMPYVLLAFRPLTEEQESLDWGDAIPLFKVS